LSELYGRLSPVGIRIRGLPGDPRAASLDDRDKGAKFERLIDAYLEADPGWTERFSEVWQWTAWSGPGGVSDIGIDLVAANRGQSGFTGLARNFGLERGDAGGPWPARPAPRLRVRSHQGAL
jgi:hypothetical protein